MRICGLFLVLTLTTFSLSGYSQNDSKDQRIWTLTKVYGVLKYYNNEKDDKYLDEGLLSIFERMYESGYDQAQFNTDIVNLIPAFKQKAHTDFSSEPEFFKRYEGKDIVRTIDLTWIDRDELLTDNTRERLKQLVYSHKKVSNSNIRKKQVLIHNENETVELPSSNYYLLALIKYWNVIQYFFPYKELMDDSWDNIFRSRIPDFYSIDSKEDLRVALTHLSASLNDSHSYIEDPRRDDFDVYKLPFSIKVLPEQLVVESVNDSISAIYQIKTGDLIESVDGRDFSEIWDEFSKNVAYSTPQGGRDELRLYLWHKFNYNDSLVRMTFHTSEGLIERDVEAITLKDYISLHSSQLVAENFKIIRPTIGYIDQSNIKYSELGKAIRKVKKLDYLILDCRGYNTGLAQMRLLNFLGNKNIPIAKSYDPDVNYPGVFGKPKLRKMKLPPKLRSSYKGQVVVLINEEPMSAMESLLMAIQLRRPEAIFIGSPTHGTNGLTSLIKLPGEIDAWFTGMDLRYPDGSQFQRLGIQPDILVEPDINSVINDEDIVLNRAIDYILGKTNKYIGH